MAPSEQIAGLEIGDQRVNVRLTSVQNHSNDFGKGGGATLVPTTSSHRRRPVPMADKDPGLRPEDDRRETGVDLLNESEH